MTESSDDTGNRKSRSYWEGAWSAVLGVEGFSLHTSAIEDAKWRHLQQDIGAKMSGRALEVGCGSGHFGALLAQSGFNVTLLDYSPAGIACAMQSFTTYSGRSRKCYLLGDALALPFSDNSIDLVVSCGVLEHFEEPLAAVKEMARVLKPGGLFYADICPERFSLLRMVELRMPQKKDWFEIRMTKAAVRKTIEEAGLRVKRLFSAGVLPLRLLQNLLVKQCAGLWSSLDGTWVADWLGCYYYVTAVKGDSDKGHL
jgi:ubiquinone/menaquinone biosynthesis C-methylase UbiE